MSLLVFSEVHILDVHWLSVGQDTDSFFCSSSSSYRGFRGKETGTTGPVGAAACYIQSSD